MMMPLPPRRPRGRSWFVSLVVLGMLWAAVVAPSLAFAQDNPTSKGRDKNKSTDDQEMPKGKDVKKDADGNDDDEQDKDKDKNASKEKAKDDSSKAERPESLDRWEDPRAEAALEIFSQIEAQLPNQADRNQVKQWAAGTGQVDATVLRRFVLSNAAVLTKKANIQSLIDVGNAGKGAKNIEQATMDLLEPLLTPQTGNNERFRQIYVRELIDVFTKHIWKGNYHSRVMAMIVLSRSGDPQAMPVFQAQLNDPDQLVIVKLLAAVGITNVAQNGRRPVEAGIAAPAAQALSDFLRREPDAFWPAQFRALEALGSLRMATPAPLSSKAEFADTAMMFLVDPKATPDVRAWAGWALGMMQVPASVRDFNFPLVAYALGQAATDLGTRVAAVPDKGMPRVLRLTDLLLQLKLAFSGDPEVRDSGLLRSQHPAAVTAQSYVMEVNKRLLSLTKECVALGQSAGTQIPKQRTVVVKQVDDFKAFLAKRPAGPAMLYAGGQEFAIPAPASAPATPKVASGGRP